MAKGQQYVLMAVVLAVLLIFTSIILIRLRPSETINKFKCSCQIPALGNKEVTVTVSGQDLPVGAVAPTNLTLSVYNYSVPCTCESRFEPFSKR